MTSRFIWIVSLHFLLACNESKEDKKEVAASLPPFYFYYPRANVYFDSANKHYFFQSSDSQSWQTAKQIPAVVQALMDKSASIHSPSDPVWKDNENHKLVYSALLYATPKDTAVNKPIAKVIRKPSKTATDTSTSDKKDRKGLRKFFDKILGRDKKKKNKEAEPQ